MEIRTENKPPVIHTPRLALRPFAEEDRPAAVALLMRPEISKTYMLPVFTGPEDAARLFARLHALSHDPAHFVYGVYAEGRLIGFFNDVEIGTDAIEVGYVIDPDHWNRGYATEALTACIGALFALGFTAVNAGFFEGNIASRRVMEKSGMRPAYRTHEIEYRGETRRCIYFTITAEEK